MAWLFRLLLIGYAALAAAAGAAELSLSDSVGRYPLAGHVDVLEDRTGELTLADVRKSDAPFAAPQAGQDLSFGYRHSALWLRVTLVPPPGGSRQSWSLELAYPTLDSVILYQPGTNGYEAMETGDLLPFASRPVVHRNFVFPMHFHGGEAHTVYLRLRSEGSLTAPLTLWQSDAFARASEVGYTGLALYFGAFIALVLYNLMLFLSLRDRLFIVYVLFVASMALGLAGQYGLAFQFLWPDLPWLGNITFPAGMMLAGLFAVLFTRGFLETHTLLPRFDQALKAVAILFAVNLPLTVINYQWSAMGVSLAAALFCPMAIGAGIWSVRRRHYGAVYYLVAWTLLLIFTAFMGLRNMGWMPTNFLTLNGMQIGSAAEMILLSFALADRYRKLHREREQAREEALAAKQQMVDTLRGQERILAQRVAERTAELQEANRKLEDNQKLLREMAHHDPLTGLANRLLLDIRLDHALRTAARQGSGVAVLLLDIDDFKPVNDRYGHAVGDELLVQLARRMQAAVREVDTVARLGGDEFIILLESVSSVEAVQAVADKLIAALQAPALTSGGISVQVGLSVGYTLAHPGETQRQALIQRADQAMYEAKHAGGNRACFRPV